MVKLLNVRERSSEIKFASKRAREDDALERIAQLIYNKQTNKQTDGQIESTSQVDWSCTSIELNERHKIYL